MCFWKAIWKRIGEALLLGVDLVIIIVYKLFALLMGREGLGIVIMDNAHLTEKGIWNWNQKKRLRVLDLTMLHP